jgi:uncharacterized protein with PQ loop repeat
MRNAFATQLFGVVGTLTVIAGYVPQVRHLIKEHCSAGVSTQAFVLWCSSSLLFLIHALMIHDARERNGRALLETVSGPVLPDTRRHNPAESITLSENAHA